MASLTVVRQSRLSFLPTLGLVGLLVFAVPGKSNAQGSVVREAGERVFSSLAGYFAKSGTRTAAKELAELGGEAAVRSWGRSLLQQGGEAAVEQAVELIGKHGPLALRALGNVDEALPVLRSLDELPVERVPLALERLSAGNAGRALATEVSEHGVRALELELRLPGVGTTLVRAFGDDAFDVAARLERDRAFDLARHANDIAALPAEQRSGVLQLIRSDTQKVVGFMGDFVRANPGKTLFSVATTAVILSQSERILGGDRLIFDPDGTPIFVSKPGLVERITRDTTSQVLKPMGIGVGWAVGLALAVALLVLLLRSRILRRWRGPVS